MRIGVDPLGGAGIHYWDPIIAKYGIAATVVNDAVDPTFRFMTVDWDGRILPQSRAPRASPDESTGARGQTVRGGLRPGVYARATDACADVEGNAMRSLGHG